jgi:hypothetical protein
MNDIYLRTPHGLVPMKYEPKRAWHFHCIEVLIIFGLGIMIGIIGSEWVITRYLPKVTCTQYTCEHNKLKVR